MRALTNNLMVVNGGPVAALDWMAGARLMKPGRIAAFGKNAALFLVAPFVGLAYVIALPFVGIAVLGWMAARAAMNR